MFLRTQMSMHSKTKVTINHPVYPLEDGLLISHRRPSYQETCVVKQQIHDSNSSITHQS